MEIIVSSVISAFSAIIVCVISQAATNRKKTTQIESQLDLIQYQLRELTDSVKRNNGIVDNAVERIFRLEERATVQEEKTKVVNHRLEDLEHKQTN